MRFLLYNILYATAPWLHKQKVILVRILNVSGTYFATRNRIESVWLRLIR